MRAVSTYDKKITSEALSYLLHIYVNSIKSECINNKYDSKQGYRETFYQEMTTMFSQSVFCTVYMLFC